MLPYVIDAYALSTIGEVVAPDRLKQVLHVLTDLVKDGSLQFPESVWKECCRYMDEQGMGLWAKTAAGHLAHDGSTWEDEDKVLDSASELVDPNSSEYQTQVDVAKLAVWLEPQGGVVVVTEDTGDRPDRMSLGNACAELAIDTMNASEFLDEVISFSYL